MSDPPVLIPAFGTPRAVRRWIRTHPAAGVRFVACGFNGEGFETNDDPLVCVAIERFPEEWPHNSVRTLLDRFPLSDWIVACGPWANGGDRTGSPWPAALRRGNAEGLRAALAALDGHGSGGAFGDRPSPAPPPGVGPALVVSPDRGYAAALARTLSGPASGGPSGPIWELWDRDHWDDRRAADLTRSRLRFPERVRVAVASLESPVEPGDAGFDALLRKWDPPEVVWAAVQSATVSAASSAASSVAAAASTAASSIAPGSAGSADSASRASASLTGSSD
ncbi:hypothetical protein LzC2_21200 [Planctomycetes bacterium LzC2]|uniref:Uncharacterized protein n=1 Tax=Alienimonas chondri TaxID=2681879 RepID=A0ABX1VGX2_9PLAN|nr:hypothetical protein [Alienimonas chondri]